MTLEELLRTQVQFPNGKSGSPDFRVAVQNISEKGVRIIIHANGHNSETLDLHVHGDAVSRVTDWPTSQEKLLKLRDR